MTFTNLTRPSSETQIILVAGAIGNSALASLAAILVRLN